MKKKTTTSTAQAILGCLIYSPEVFYLAAQQVRPEMFGSSILIELAAAVWVENEKGRSYAPSDLRDQFPELAPHILKNPTRPDQIETACMKLKTAWEAQQLSDIYAAAAKIAQDGDGIAARQHADGEIEMLSGAIARPDDKVKVLMSSMALMDKYLSTSPGNRVTGIETGFPRLNSFTGGWQTGEMAVLAARPGVGKTTSACQCGIAAARKGHPVLYFTIGDSPSKAIYMKMACIIADVDVFALRQNQVTDADKARLYQAYEELETLPITVIDTAQFSGTIGGMRDITRREAMAWDKEGLLVVDYIQQLRPDKSKGVIMDDVGAVSNDIKHLLGKVECAGLILSQMSRDIEKRGGRPKLSDLRETGRLEQDADKVFFLIREESNTLLLPMKDRQGAPMFPQPEIDMNWRTEWGRYEWVFDSFTPAATASANYTESPFPAPDNNGAMAAHRPGEEDLPF